MTCLNCRELERAYEAAHSEYLEARSSVWLGLSSSVAARKNVDMERTRYDLEEHRIVCVCQ
jgi:hypothetical protein